MKQWGAFLLACCLAAMAGFCWTPARADKPPLASSPSVEETCPVESSPEWNETEAWAWGMICSGQTADFNERLNKTLDIESHLDVQGDSERKLSGSFLETILFREPFRSAITRKGVRIIGAYFHDAVDLENGETPHELWLRESWFDEPVNLGGFRVRHLDLGNSTFAKAANLSYLTSQVALLLQGAKFLESLDLRYADVNSDIRLDAAVLSRQKGHDELVSLHLDEARIGGNLAMSGGEFGDVTLSHAKIEGGVTIRNSRFFGPLVMNSVRVARHVVIAEQSSLSGIDLAGAAVGGQLRITDSLVETAATMDDVTVDGNVYLTWSGFDAAELAGARITGQLSAEHADFERGLDLNWAQINGAALLGGAIVGEELDLRYADVGKILDLSGATLSTVDMEGARIGEEFRLYSEENKETRWSGGGQLNLSHAAVTTISDAESAWPNEMSMRGFTFKGWLGDALYTRPADWFYHWLKRDPSPSAQGFFQLDKILRSEGLEGLADDLSSMLLDEKKIANPSDIMKYMIIYVSQNAVTNQNDYKVPLADRLKMTAANVVDEYGYHREKWISWAILFFILSWIGSYLLKVGGANPHTRNEECFRYSLSRLLPLGQIVIKTEHEYELRPLTRYYLSFISFFGWVALFTLILAGHFDPKDYILRLMGQ